jgi:sulfotransferase family protein
MTLPNFLLIGTAKAGTTSLYYYLRQHPQVFLSNPKEPKFFSYEGENVRFGGPGDREKNRLLVNNIDDYRQLFSGVTGEKAIGEATALYLYLPKAAERIRHYTPQARMIAILRHPAERAYSSFVHLVRDGRESVTDFERALELEPERVRKNYHPMWHYRALGYYYSQVKRYFDLFGRQQLKIFLYEDLKADSLRVVREVCWHLGIDDSFVPDLSEKFNVGAMPKSRRLQSILLRTSPARRKWVPRLPSPIRWRVSTGVEKLQAWNRRTAPSLSPEARARMVADYREDILRLQDLLQRDLTHWLQ